VGVSVPGEQREKGGGGGGGGGVGGGFIQSCGGGGSALGSGIRGRWQDNGGKGGRGRGGGEGEGGREGGGKGWEGGKGGSGGRGGHLLLFLVHTRAIRDGAFDKFRRHFCPLGFDRTAAFVNISESSGKGVMAPEMFREASFIFCLFQSFEKLPEKVVQKVTHVVVDECHHLLATSYGSIFSTLRRCARIQYCLGMTATLRHRTDQQGTQLQELFQGVKYVDLPEMSAKRLGFFPAVEYLESLPTLGSIAGASSSAPQNPQNSKMRGGGGRGRGTSGSNTSSHKRGANKTGGGGMGRWGGGGGEYPTYANHVAALAVHKSVSRFVREMELSVAGEYGR
jgi:hypothetical protein